MCNYSESFKGEIVTYKENDEGRSVIKGEKRRLTVKAKLCTPS